MAINGGVFLKDELGNDRVIDALRVIDSYFKDKYGLGADQVLELGKEEAVPLSAFSTPGLGTLEIVVRYLRDVRGKKFSEIARLLSRDARTIWCTYANSRKKNPSDLDISDKSLSVPVSVFADRRRGALGCLVVFLKDVKQLSFARISEALGRHYQTVWTTYRKVKNE